MQNFAGLGNKRGVLAMKSFSKILLAAFVIAASIYVCFAYAERAERVLGHTGTEIAVRLSAFILLCIGVQIFWTGAAELIQSLPTHSTQPVLPKPAG